MSNRRFEMHDIRTVLVRMRQGDSDRAIAKAGLMGRRKLRWLRALAEQHGWLDATKPLPNNAELAPWVGLSGSAAVGEPRTLSASSVAPYREQVETWAHQGIQATTIHQALIRNHQYTGSYSSVYRFVSSLNLNPPKATTRLSFSPGEAAQVDFGTGPPVVDPRTGELAKTWFFLMTLAFSRHQYAELVRDQRIDTWLECHRRAFEWFGGVPGRIIIDNPKCAITRACYHDPTVQRAYAEYAEGYGFRIDPCPPGDPQKKGRVESGIKYLKRGFVPTRTFRHLHDANTQLQQWILGGAGNRIHGTTGEQPLIRFAAEKSFLSPLPANPPELAAWAKLKVHRDAHVQYAKCLYSVPHGLIGQTLWLKATAHMIRIYRDLELVAIHPRAFLPGSRRTQADHLPPHVRAYQMKTPTWCRQRARKVGTACHAVIEYLFHDRVLHNLRAAQGILSLAGKYGNTRLEAACQRALDFHNPRYGTIKTILQKGLDAQPNNQSAFDALADCYTGQGKYCRDTRQLLKH